MLEDEATINYLKLFMENNGITFDDEFDILWSERNKVIKQRCRFRCGVGNHEQSIVLNDQHGNDLEDDINRLLQCQLSVSNIRIRGIR